jgi:hypothetical protein
MALAAEVLVRTLVGTVVLAVVVVAAVLLDKVLAVKATTAE